MTKETDEDTYVCDACGKRYPYAEGQKDEAEKEFAERFRGYKKRVTVCERCYQKIMEGILQ